MLDHAELLFSLVSLLLEPLDAFLGIFSLLLHFVGFILGLVCFTLGRGSSLVGFISITNSFFFHLFGFMSEILHIVLQLLVLSMIHLIVAMSSRNLCSEIVLEFVH